MDNNKYCRALCLAGSFWYQEGNKQLVLYACTFHAVTKTWNYFLGSRLLPVKHMSEVTVDRAILLYAILNNPILDAGRVISNKITALAQELGIAIFFPGLITELCANVGVQ